MSRARDRRRRNEQRAREQAAVARHIAQALDPYESRRILADGVRLGPPGSTPGEVVRAGIDLRRFLR